MQLAGSSSYQHSSGYGAVVSHHSLVNLRSGLIVAGVFILLIALALLYLGRSPKLQLRSAAITSKPTASLNQTEQSSQASGTSSNVSTSVDSSTSGSSSQTNVTVNGQPISVPENGSIQTTVGNTRVNISHSSSSSGSASNRNVTSTNLSVSASSSNGQKGGN